MLGTGTYIGDFSAESGNGYRYAFQGQEGDNELNGVGNSYAFMYRIHDPRLGRFLSLDPLSKNFPWNSPYSFAENKVIQFIELEGKEIQRPAYFDNNRGLVMALDNPGSYVPQVTISDHQKAALGDPNRIDVAAALKGTKTTVGMGGFQASDQYRITQINVDLYADFFVPREIILKALNGEEISNFDIGIEIAGVLPFGKVLGKVGKKIVKSEFAEGAMKELATFFKNNADESAGVIRSRLQKSIKSHKDQIAKHKEWINDPKKKYGDEWDTFSDTRKENTIHHWKEDIKRHESFIQSKEGALTEIDNLPDVTE